jgi:hypothetical protein
MNYFANWPENLNTVSQWLGRYPNMVVEFGARETELGRQPRRARKFFLEYQDRILFGTDSECMRIISVGSKGRRVFSVCRVSGPAALDDLRNEIAGWSARSNFCAVQRDTLR